MNTGGRTHVLVHTYSDAAGHRHIQLTDRYGTQDVDLVSLRLGKAPDQVPPRLFIGTFSGEAYPLKFIAPAQLNEESAAIKKE